jgi:hypothetical protein
MTSWVIVGFVVVLAGTAIGVLLFRAESHAKTANASGSGAPEYDPNAKRSLEDRELLSIAIGANEAIVANIDTLNAAAVGILALPVALLVFAVDKVNFSSPLGVLALVLTSLSTISGAISYEFGYFFWNRRSSQERTSGVPQRIQDALDPRRFVILYGLRGDDAITEQLDQTIKVSMRNAKLRTGKRVWAQVSLVLFIAAAASVASDQAVPTSRERVVKPCTVTVSTPVRAKIVVQCP